VSPCSGLWRRWHGGLVEVASCSRVGRLDSQSTECLDPGSQPPRQINGLGRLKLRVFYTHGYTSMGLTNTYPKPLYPLGLLFLSL
jgi:hypothetical protein